jgi:hypothetical protein
MREIDGLGQGRSWNFATSNRNPFDLIERDLITGTVVQLGGARAFVRGHELGVFECAAGFEIGADPGRPKGVAADLDLHQLAATPRVFRYWQSPLTAQEALLP